MNPLKHTPLQGSIFAVALTALVLILSLLLRTYLEANVLFLFIAPVWLCSWYYGRTGGLAAVAASVLAIAFFLVNYADAPFWSMPAKLAAFALTASVIAWVTGSWRNSRRLLAWTLSSIADAVVAADRDGRITFLNPVAETLTGWQLHEAKGKPAEQILRFVDEETRRPVPNPLMRALRERVVVAMQERTALVSRSGAEVSVEHTVSPVRSQSGRVRGAILVLRDISKRSQVEEQAIHAQKMDAVGRLAGGVAGDFNNVLTVVTGNAELLRAEAPPGSPTRRFVDEIVYAGERAAALTRQLLAFSRGSTAQPRVVDLNTVVAGMAPMLRRLLGQNVELTLLTSPHLGHVKADASQMEQVVVNLATNARDAMPQGGKLVIETANVDLEDGAASKNLGVKAGSYVMLAVSDTGVGMDPETRSRLFEPFFTTKPAGKGSGLGLATVYGAVRQSDGQVTVYSQPGCGTIFEIYLPRVEEPLEEPPKRSAKGSETILVVDDEEGVRKLVCAVLKSNGYEVLEANHSAAAFAAFEKNAHKIDMVLTDVVMPQMSGFEMGRQLAGRAPELKILYMSGYRDHDIGVPPGQVPKAFLRKPFTPDALLAKVREVLDAETV